MYMVMTYIDMLYQARIRFQVTILNDDLQFEETFGNIKMKALL